MSSPGIEQLTKELVDDLRPVRRVLSPTARTGLWVALEVVVLAYVLAVEARPDVGALFAMPLFVLEFVAFVVAASALAMMAFRSGVPGTEIGWPVRALAVASVGVAVAHVFALPLRTNGLFETFLAGRGCAVRMVAFAVVPWLVILVALRRAAPFRGALSGAFAAGAASLMAFAFMRITCPADELLHVLTWHGAPVAIAVGVSAVVGALWLPRWRR